ncbi:MAG: hypothetical protein WC765_06195 [Phycisphaerae bacterium]|jgi:hypothetical protein
MKALIAGIGLMAVVMAARGMDAQYPDSVEVSCGKLEVRLGAATFWNMNRVIYDQLPISADLTHAYWGTVFEFPEIGLIGSGHRDKDNNSEKIIDFQMFADGKPVSLDGAAGPKKIVCGEFRMEKRAQVKDIEFNYGLTIRNDQLTETCTLKAARETPLKLMYNFMHPWSDQMTDYYIQVKEAVSKQGKFTTDEKFSHQDPFIWVALYNANIGAGIVSKAAGEDVRLFLWDRKQYKKTYLCSFYRKTMPAGKEVTYKMKTDFFKESPDGWLNAAKEKANQLQ